jgi:hypothetical protein
MTGVLDPLAQASVDWLDEIAIGFERKWGVDRLAKLVDPVLGIRFRAQAEKLNEALRCGRSDAVNAQASAMVRAWIALDAAATKAGATPFSPLVWETTLPTTGEVIAIVRDEAEALAIAKDRSGAVWTLSEVAIAIEAFGDKVRAVKAAFPGAQVTEVRPQSLNIGATPRVQHTAANKRTNWPRRFAGGRWPSVAGATTRSPLFDTPSAKPPVDWERGDEIPF